MILPIPTMAISSGNASGTTRSAVGNGTITVRDTSQQTQDVGTLSRNTDDANGHIKIFDEKKIAEQQELASVFGQMANSAAGDLGEAMGWGSNSPEKAAIHGVIGAIQASFGGGNALAGGLAGMSSEAFGQMVDTYLSNNTQLDRNERGAITQWAATLSGSAIGGIIGGTTGAQSGAAVSLDAERYNRQLHPDEVARIKQLSGGDKDKEARLKAAACALVKCSAEFAESSPDYVKAQALEQLGNSDAYASERKLLASQSGNQLIYAMGSYASASLPMFGYSVSDQTGDALSHYGVGTRLGGLTQFTAGELQAVGGAAICTTTAGVACLAGGYLAASGIDTANAGFNTFLSGVNQKTSGAYLLEGLGVSPDYSEGIYGLTQVGAAGIGSWSASGLGAVAQETITGAKATAEALKPTSIIKVTEEMKADPYHPDWQRYVGNEPRAVGADVVSGEAKYTTRFIDGIEVVDQKTGQIFKGTVDLGPTLHRIKSGGSFPHRNDGSIFQNRALDLPQKPAGYYTAYVNPTPGIVGPGPQRIVVGKGGEMYYTADHYKTFITIKN